MTLVRGNVLVEVDATVGKLAERSLPLELCIVCQPHVPSIVLSLSILQRQHDCGHVESAYMVSCSIALRASGKLFVGNG